MIDLSSLPPEVRALIEAQAATIARQDAELLVQRDTIAKMRLQLDRLRRMQFGRSSEKIAAEIAQLTLALEELEANPETHVDKAAEQPASAAKDDHQKPARRPFPDHLPRVDVEHESPCTCPHCGGTLRRLGEDVTEVLDYVPASFRVIRNLRPKFSCRVYESISQAAAPELPIRRGRATAGLLAHILAAKFADHLPLYRQSEIYAREGVQLERSMLADWVGQSLRCCVLSSRRWSDTCYRVSACMPTTHLFQYWHPERAGPRRVGCGRICVTSGPMPAQPRQR